MIAWLWTAHALAGSGGVPPRPADCPPAPRDAALALADDVERAWIDNDVDGFDVAAESLARTIGCVDEPLDLPEAIVLHQAMGLRAFASHDDAAAARSLRAIRLLDPAWRTSAGWMQEDAGPYALYRQELPHHEVSVPSSARGELRVDGRTTDLVPSNEAFVLQVVDRHDTALYTGYHASVATLPDLGAARSSRGTIRAVGTAVSAALLGGAAISEVAASNARARLRDPETPTAELTGLYARANDLDTVALGLALGTAGTAAVAWFVPW